MRPSDQAEASRKFWIRSGYVHAPGPEYFADESTTVIYQPDVYALAFSCARRLGAKRVIDVGCGQARKLSQGHPEFEVVGVDFGANMDFCRGAYGFGRWLQHDLDSELPLPLEAADMLDAVAVCSDVIEHVAHPERLLEKPRSLLDGGARALLISTPERDLTRGLRDPGPPENRAHIREWSIREFEAWLEENGFRHRSSGLTRSNDETSLPATILTLASGNAVDLACCKPVLVDFMPADCTPKPHRFRTRLRLAARMLLLGR